MIGIQLRRSACYGLCVIAMSGCYDAEALLEQRRIAAIQQRLEEVDLGEYRVTLPPAEGTSTHGVVAFHAFGQVANQDLERLEASLAGRGPELDHQVLLAVRGLALEDIEDPELTALRRAIQQAANHPFDKPLVQQIGFYKFNFMPL